MSNEGIVVARLSAEAEFRAMAHGVCEFLWMKIILDDLNIEEERPMKLVKIADNPVHNLIALNISKWTGTS